MFRQIVQHVLQEADVSNPVLAHASCVTVIIIKPILIKNSINFEILVQKEIEACLWEQSCTFWNYLIC